MDVEKDEKALNDEKPASDELCRLCANVDKNFIPIFQGEGIEHNISEQIKKYLPIITVTKVDKLPLQICYQCTSTLLAWHNFFEQCRVADNRLREILSVNEEFNRDDDSCHDYADNFCDDFDDQPSVSNRVCDSTREKAVHFKLSGDDTGNVKTSDNTTAKISEDVSKSVTENVDENRCLRMINEATDKKCAYANMLGLKSRSRCSSRHSKSTMPQVEDTIVAPTDSKSIVNERLLDICPCVWSNNDDCSKCAPYTEFKCAYCPMVFPAAQLRNRHLRSAHQDVLFEYCFNWMYENSLKTSTEEAPPEVTEKAPIFRCHDYAAPFTDKEALVDHVRAHDKNKRGARMTKVFFCDHCGVSSTTKVALVAHLRSAHAHIFGSSAERGVGPAPDARQNQALGGRLDLAQYVFVQNGRKYLKCDQCSFTCRHERTKLTDHMRVHTGEKPFTCETCGKQFRTRTLLGVHQRYVHEGVKKFPCDICGRHFSSRRYMQDHRRIHTGERPLICHLCGNSFRQSSTLMKHLEHHTGVKRHACHLCAKRFTNAHRLRIHIKRHLGEVSHVCAECGKAFIDQGQLKEHLAVHSEARPHVCPLCGACFKLRKHLRQHGRTHRLVS